jgi:hypothetical protein
LVQSVPAVHLEESRPDHPDRLDQLKQKLPKSQHRLRNYPNTRFMYLTVLCLVKKMRNVQLDSVVLRELAVVEVP